MRAPIRFIALLAAAAAFIIPTASASAQSCALCVSNPPIAGPIGPVRGQQLVTDGGFENANATTPAGSAAWTGWHRYYETLSSSTIPRAHCTNSPGTMSLAGYTGKIGRAH